jgi:hypothetical protein
MVRDTGDHLHIRRDLGQEIFGVKLVQLFLAIAADHHRHLVDERVRYHCGDGLIGAVRVEFCTQMLVPNVFNFCSTAVNAGCCHDRPLLVCVE